VPESQNQYAAFLEILGRSVKIPAGVDFGYVLVDGGLDSLKSIRLVVDLEESLSLRIPDEFLTAAAFETVGSLWSMVSTLLNRGGDGFN
jgi:acyl carrier protein